MKRKAEKLFRAIKGNLTNHSKLDYLFYQAWNDYKNSKVNLGQLQRDHNSQKKKIRSFREVEFQVFSQFGDDGIIQWLVQFLPLPYKTFVEFGVENYRESNTRFLLVSDYWSGLVIDGSNENIDSIKTEQIHTFFDLQPVCSFIDKDNINDTIASARFHEDVGLLSVDIDGNDYWVWKAINSIKPIIVITEYNSLFGYHHPYTIEYKPDFVRGQGSPFNFYGTSLRSAYNLGREKGYEFVGCNSAGNNAYFIRKDFMQYLPLEPLTPEEGFVYASFSEATNKNGEPARGIDKIRSIDGLEAVNTDTGEKIKINAEEIAQLLIKSNKLNRF